MFLFFIGGSFPILVLGFGVNGIIGGRVHQKSIKGKRAGALALPALGRWGVGGRPAVYSREIPAGFPGCTGVRPMKRSERKDRRESELFLRSFLSLLFAPPTGMTCLYTPSDSHQLLLLLLCLLLWPTRQVIDLCAYRL